jgi:uncharacterized protein YbcI
MDKIDELKSDVARQIAEVALVFHQQRTGHTPKSITVILIADTLVITLHGALTPAEQALAQNVEGATQVREFHRELFANSAAALRQEIRRITGVEVKEAVAEVEPTIGSVVQVFTTGAMVQMFQLSRDMPTDSWSGHTNGERLVKNEA